MRINARVNIISSGKTEESFPISTVPASLSIPINFTPYLFRIFEMKKSRNLS